MMRFLLLRFEEEAEKEAVMVHDRCVKVDVLAVARIYAIYVVRYLSTSYISRDLSISPR